jgi:amidase
VHFARTAAPRRCGALLEQVRLKRITTASLLLAALVATAWLTGLVDRIAIDHFVRRPQQQNLARQLESPEGYAGRRALDFSPFSAPLAELRDSRARELDALLESATILDVQRSFQRGEFSAYELSLYFLARIRTLDGALHAVTELDPGALGAAERLDAERSASGPRGPMHGIPVLLKDNISSGGALHTTAGARALEDSRASRDAFIVRRLREAGAVILGKTALSEWANFMSVRLPNGFSAVGGQVRNPYGPFDVSGSSSGSAVAVASSLATVSVGTETWGSLIFPASQNSVVAIKPSVGLVSRDGILPMVGTQDTAGPMARNVTDAAILLGVLAAADANDGATSMTPKPVASYADALDANGLKGRRIGVVRLRGDVTEGDGDLLAEARVALERGGAEVVALPPRSILSLRAELNDFYRLADHDFKRGVNAHLAAVSARVGSLSDVIAFNSEEPFTRAPFGQDLLIGAEQSQTTEADYRETSRRVRTRARNGIEGMLADHDVDMLVAISQPFYVPYAAAGYPALSVPAGHRESGEPVGLTFIGGYLEESELIRAAFAFEQLTRARRPPKPQP